MPVFSPSVCERSSARRKNWYDSHLNVGSRRHRSFRRSLDRYDGLKDFDGTVERIDPQGHRGSRPWRPSLEVSSTRLRLLRVLDLVSPARRPPPSVCASDKPSPVGRWQASVGSPCSATTVRPRDSSARGDVHVRLPPAGQEPRPNRVLPDTPAGHESVQRELRLSVRCG